MINVLSANLACACMLAVLWAALAPHSVVAADNTGKSGGPTIASLDYCADQFVLAVADRGQIAALSREATSVYSFFREAAAGIPETRGTTEEILTLAPDVLVRQWRGSPVADALFARAGTEPVVLPFAASSAEAFEHLLAFGAQLDRLPQAEAFVAKRKAMQQRLDEAAKTDVKALYVTPSGYSAGLGTSVDKMIKSAGLDTMAADYDIAGWVPLPIEAIVRTPPEAIVTSFFDLPRARSNWSLAGHPQIGGLLESLPVIDLPARYLTCNEMFAVDAASFVRDEAERLGLAQSTANTPTTGASRMDGQR